MKKSLSEAQFQKAVQGLDVKQQTLEIAHGVLVEGRQQSEFVELYSVTKGAVWQAVQRVWEAHQVGVPDGFERVTAVLPDHQAFIVRKWEAAARQQVQKDQKEE